MSIFTSFSKSSTLKAAIKKVSQARNQSGGEADLLYQSAYQGFAQVVSGDLNTGEALHNWGFALLHQARAKQADQEDIAKALYREALDKFRFCLLVSPMHLGGAIDGGVAYMELARLENAVAGDPLYDQAFEFFKKAESIQRGSASYNMACIYALRNQPEACLKALEQSKESGSLPDEQEVLNDPDMSSIKDAQWFHVFLGRVEVAQAEQVENDRRTRRGLKDVEEIKLDLPPRPTDSVLRRHYDAMIKAQIDEQKERIARDKQEAEERRLDKRKRGDTFDYYK